MGVEREGRLSSTPPRAGVRVVGLGASAGGLEPLQQFLGAVPPASGLAYIVVQHLDPTHQTLLCELLQRVTRMPVHEAADARVIEADTVYVIAPDSELSVLAGALRVAAPAQSRGRRLPVDALLGSLAREFGEQAVGVVLSGMGADGTQGLRSIAAAGGLTLAQEPASAQFDSMPRSAIDAHCARVVALPAQMPARILAHIGAGDGAGGPPSPVEDDPEVALRSVLELLQQRTRHDFSSYKSSTQMRRIARRMALHGLATLGEYAGFLRDNAQELDLLFKEMLIGVTSFFRDPEVWRELQDAVLPALMARPSADDAPLRAWVVGCSTGEEAYSLAMAFVEAADALAPAAPREFQIFATDLGADAVAAARAGRFSARSVRDLAPQRLARFFTAQSDGYRIDKRIRDRVLFAQHDVVLDPPFTRLDLLSCRNVMIYFDAALQRRLVPLFHYSLRPGGFLLLGSSETVGRAPSLFTPLHPKSRLYRRGDNGGAAGAVVFPTHRRSASRPAAPEAPLTRSTPPAANLQSLADQLLLQAFSPPAVLVNATGDILYIHGRTGRFLEPAAGKANWNIHVMARPALRAPLAGALRTAVHDGTVVELRDLRLDEDAGAAVDITVQSVAPAEGGDGMALIVFRDVPEVAGRRARRAKPASGVDAAALGELARARAELHALRQEMLASKEQLQAANEELQSTNEELQSANEELTTSKEEAQSMNEELQTINGELQSKLDDLALAQSDMQNLLNSTDIATLFLDKDLNVRRFTEQIARVVHLRPNDVGRPLSELASTLIYPEMHADVSETLRTLAVSEKQIATRDGLWFTVRIMPYRTLANVIAGVVITFIDITIAKELEARLRKA